MDYTAIIVSLVSLFGMIWQSMHNGKVAKRNDLRREMEQVQVKLDAVTAGQEFVLQDRLLHLCDSYLDKGSVTAMELKLLTNMYHAYHDLGGNDFITDLFERVKELPIR